MMKNKEMSPFGTNEQNAVSGIVNLSELHEFKGHPFKVESDTKLYELMKSIEENGVLVPLIVRRNPNGNGFEIIAGHRRKAACEWAGLEKVPVMVMELNDAEAVIAIDCKNEEAEILKRCVSGLS